MFSIIIVSCRPLVYYIMKNVKLFIFIIVIIIVGIAALFFVKKTGNKSSPQSTVSTSEKLINNINNMKITSPSFENNRNIPPKYTCDGENISPPLEFSDVPAGARSLVLILHDPDAPLAGGFTHWVIFNIDPSTKEIAENSRPASGVEGVNSSGKTGYASPCPPSGVHHYQFKFYALDETLNLDSSAKREDVEKAMEGHALDQSMLVGLYQRQ